MRWQERQDKTEQTVYDAINELSEILSIELPYYPEVWWMGNALKFNQLGLPEFLRDELEFRQSTGISYYIPTYKMVMIGRKVTEHAILEESSHAFHFIRSGVSYSGRTTQEMKCLHALVEMMGMLGARILGSKLENPYDGFPDVTRMTKESQKQVSKLIEEKIGDGYDIDDFFIYQQGYGLADRIYFRYLTDEVKLSQIRRLFLSKLNGKEGVIGKFVRLKNKYWPHENLQAV
jgi:hypothetical protein